MEANAVTWSRLRAWISEKEAYERATNKSAQLTSKEILAIRALIPDAVVESDSEPEVGEKDWVSELLNLVQANRLTHPTFKDQEAFVSLGKTPSWRTSCTLVDGPVIGTFPRNDPGAKGNKTPPTFKNKKTAKQYAAKQALNALREAMPGTSTQKITTPPKSGQKAVPHDASPSSPVAKRVKHSPSPGTSRDPSATSAAVNSSSIFESVARAAVSLGMDAPRFDIESEENTREGFFKGRAIFKPGTKVPEGLGAVDGVLGKNECKAQVAQALLSWMQDEKIRREELVHSLIHKQVN